MSKDTKVKEAEIIEEVKNNGTVEPENKAKEETDNSSNGELVEG